MGEVRGTAGGAPSQPKGERALWQEGPSGGDVEVGQRCYIRGQRGKGSVHGE